LFRFEIQFNVVLLRGIVAAGACGERYAPSAKTFGVVLLIGIVVSGRTGYPQGRYIA